jgi:hypothetical protein
MKLFSLLVVLCSVIGLSCASHQSLTVRTLPSGKQVKVIGIGPVTFEDGTTSIMLKYQTDLRIADSVRLRREVEEIWQEFRVDAEKARMNVAIISAYEDPGASAIQTGKTFNYVFEKIPDGNWRMVNK